MTDLNEQHPIVPHAFVRSGQSDNSGLCAWSTAGAWGRGGMWCERPFDDPIHGFPPSAAARRAPKGRKVGTHVRPTRISS